MKQYYIVEVKKDTEYSHDTFWEWDEDDRKARLKAESKYYSVLSDAAVSRYATHAAILFSEEGVPLMHECYFHTVEESEE